MKTKAVKKILLALVCTTLTIALGACAGDRADDDRSQITIGIPQDVEDSLDPHKAVAAGTEEILFNLYEGLVKPDSDGNLVDALAESHTISDDGLVYTFTLRQNVKFHDGSVMTADDVKYSLDRCADTSSGAPLVAAFSAIESVNILDERTVEVVLTEPDKEFLPYMTAAIIPQANETPEKNPIGTGPYKYVSRAPQENFVMEKFDDYWGEGAHIDLVTLKVIANSDTIVTSLNGGAIDMFLRITLAQSEQVSDDYQVLEGTMNLVQAMYLNNKAKPFDDIRVRQALCYAVDPAGIMEINSNGKGTQVGSSMFPAFGKYYMEELNDLYETDLDKARELLADAGYPDGFSFTLTVPSNYPQHVNCAQVIVEQLKEIGVEAKIQLVEWESWLSTVYTDRNYEATVVGLDASSLTPAAMLRRFTGAASNNFINYQSADYDEAFEKALTSVDDAEKTQYYKECERILAQDAANVYIQDLPCFVALNKKYGGYEFYPLYVQNFASLYLVEEQNN